MFYKNTQEIHVHPHHFIHSLYAHHIRTGLFNLLRAEKYRCKKLWDTKYMTLSQEIIIFVLKTLALVSGIILVALIIDICTVYGMYTR